MQRIRVGDTVVVTSGDDKGKRGKVTRLLLDTDRLVIEGINQVKRHVKATPQSPGGILEVEAPIHASRVMLIDPETDKPTRVRFETKGDKKVRVAKSGGEIHTPEGGS
jgi:large subunit ribosomal protein L24